MIVFVPKQRISYNEVLKLDSITAFVGSLVGYTPDSQYFMFNDMKVVCPGLSQNNDNNARSYQTLLSLTNAVFAEATDAEQVFPEGTPQYAYFSALNDKGIKASHVSKAAIMRALKIWVELKKTEVRKQQVSTDRLNAGKVARIAENKKVIKSERFLMQEEVRKLLSSSDTSVG